MWVLNPKMPCKVKSSGEIVLMLKRPQKNKMQREKKSLDSMEGSYGDFTRSGNSFKGFLNSSWHEVGFCFCQTFCDTDQ